MSLSKKQKEALPSTLDRSDGHAQEIYGETLESAIAQYGDGERAHRTAFAALKHSYEKVGDHWEEKEAAGPSDASAEQGGLNAKPSAGGVDANASKEHLLEIARKLDVAGRSTMTKDELVEALQQANARETARSRDD